MNEVNDMKRMLIPLLSVAAALSCAALAYGASLEGINGGPGVMLKEMAKDKTEDMPETKEDPVDHMTALGTDIRKLDLPGDAEVVVVVEGSGLDASVSAYERDALTAEDGSVTYGDWRSVISTAEGKLGRKGLGKTVEGDEKTPVGIFRMNTPFGIKDPLEGFPENYIKVTSDMYWNGDSASPLYNRLVSTDTYDDFSRSKSEHLIDYGGYYNYCIDMGYNPEGTPHRGSALFLHCSMGINTGGCIAIPEDVMTEIMRTYREGKTYIAVGDKADMASLYAADEA